ncbi:MULTISPECIES: aspartate--tRNA(Asn) ligase [unclassified Sphingomonas]|jgi:aspartyl/asparaginyl-tRNA synthetase|uniref:aspartate--tRNA(Asn) ligase n=1 Tax=unclassified Sphingomonas TaxID=196159 RepID=UPI0006933AA3|nr:MULTISPECIES: aspartate--tRNA(Asn) ligase [unclassified Sphingomonas]MDY1007356.1 aspartate--tRNA(Asn) ligase [Sphingomonas sp. CFBP9019]
MNLPFTPEAVTARPLRSLIGDLSKFTGQQVKVCGWISSARRGRDIDFWSVRDRSGTVQIVRRGADRLDVPLESAVQVTGRLVANPAGRYGGQEIHAETIEVVARAEISPAGSDTNDRFDRRHLDLRVPERLLIFDVATTFLAAARKFLVEGGFLEIQTPKITAGGSESGAAVFHLPYFGESACLVQSPQFYVQLAMAAGFDRVFEVGPSFRAEEVETHRHATEFTSLDVEMSWIESHHELMDLEEDLLRHALVAVEQIHGAAIERAFGVKVQPPSAPIPRISYADALGIVGEAQPGGQRRMTQRAEQALCKYYQELYGQSFVFVTDFPQSERSFYTMRTAEKALEGRSFDLLWRGLEVSSGCQREHRYEPLVEQTRQAGIEAALLERYLNPFYFPMFQHGCPTHGGFGLGINRLLMVLLGQSSIGETSFVYRSPTRFRP